MPQSNQIIFTHKELATILIQKQGIHEGWWGIFIRFGLRGANVGESPSDFLPAAIVPVREIGLQKFDKETNLSVNAAEVNPPIKKKSPKRTGKKK
jgi:hypothetical protein